jgi:hypothetical protein
MITESHLKRCMSYAAYKDLLEKLLKQGKTTGFDQGPDKLNNAGLNIQRMLRVERNAKLTDDFKSALSKIKGEYHWMVITEGWCADTAQQIPIFAAIEKTCPAVSLCLLLRDENPEVMDQYLTNGTRSIPKIICLERRTFKEMFTWGPRPAELQEQIMQLKKENADKGRKALVLQKWYNADKTLSLQRELAELIRTHLVAG